MSHTWNRSRRTGFTLMELVIVLVVLAILAGLVVPIFGWVRDQARYATAAAGAAELLKNLETYKAATGSYPNRLDSLVGTDGSVYNKVYGVAGAGQFPYGATVDSSSSTIYYFLANGGGMSEVMQHNPSATDPNNSNETLAPVPVSSASFVTIDPASVAPFYEAKMRRIVRAAFPNQTGTGNNLAIPAGHTLVALGVGPRASCVGTTMSSAPLHGGAAKGSYGRYIAIFDIAPGNTGRGRIQLKMVCDSEFEVLARNVANAEGSAPVDDQGVFVPPAPVDPPPSNP